MEQALPYIHRRVGFNYRMTEMQSAIGIEELKRVDSWNIPQRRRSARIITNGLKDCPQIKYLPVHNKKKKNAFYVYPVVLNLDNLRRCDKAAFLNAVIAEGVYAWKEFWPQSYKEKAFTCLNGFGRFKFPFKSKEYTDPGAVEYNRVFCPNCAWLEERTFVVHIWPTIRDEHARLIAKAIRKVARAYAK